MYRSQNLCQKLGEFSVKLEIVPPFEKNHLLQTQVVCLFFLLFEMPQGYIDVLCVSYVQGRKQIHLFCTTTVLLGTKSKSAGTETFDFHLIHLCVSFEMFITTNAVRKNAI